MEQTSKNTQNNVTDKIIEEEVKQEEVVSHNENTTNSKKNMKK